MKPVNKPRTQFLKGIQWHDFFPPWNHRFKIRDPQYASVYFTLFPFIFKGWVLLDLPFTLGLDVPSPQSLQVWRGFSFSVWAGEQSSHAHSCHRDASCPLYFGALGRNSCSIGLAVLSGYLLILLCRAQNWLSNVFPEAAWGAGLSLPPLPSSPPHPSGFQPPPSLAQQSHPSGTDLCILFLQFNVN